MQTCLRCIFKAIKYQTEKKRTRIKINKLLKTYFADISANVGAKLTQLGAHEAKYSITQVIRLSRLISCCRYSILRN